MNLYQSGAMNFEDGNMGVGVAVVTADALATGQVPDPLSDLSQDWYYWHAWRGLLGFEAQHYQQFDIKTSRCLREGYRLMWATQHFTQEVATLMQVNLRTLWTLQ